MNKKKRKFKRPPEYMKLRQSRIQRDRLNILHTKYLIGAILTLVALAVVVVFQINLPILLVIPIGLIVFSEIVHLWFRYVLKPKVEVVFKNGELYVNLYIFSFGDMVRGVTIMPVPLPNSFEVYYDFYARGKQEGFHTIERTALNYWNMVR